MNSRSRLTLLLLCVVTGLMIFLLSTEGQDENPAPPVISEIAPESIENIVIARTGKETIRLRKNKGHWRITAPMQLDANPARIKAILQILQTPSLAQLNAADVNLSTLQLERPETTLHLNQHVFSFGATEALDARRYVMFAELIHLIEDRVYHLLRQGALFFASPRLLPQGFVLKELVHPAWRMTTGEDTEPLFSAWQNAKAQAIRPYVGGEPLGRISAKTVPGRSITFIIMAKEPTWVLARPDAGIEYQLDNDTGRQLLLRSN